MTKRNIFLIAVCLTVGLSLGGEVQAQPTRDVNVVNEPNVSVLNNVDVNVTNDTTNPVPVVIQNGTSAPPVKELVEIIQLDVPGGTTLNPFTVPSGKRLLITDVIISTGGGATGLEILRDGAIVSRIQEFNSGAEQIYNHSYVSGIEFKEGELLSIRTGGATGNITHWELRGQLTDIS